MKVKFKKELPDAKMPYKKNNDDFCYDLYAATDAQPVYDDDGNLIPNVWCYDTGISYEIVRDNEELETVYRPDIEIPDIGTDEERKAFLESIENKLEKSNLKVILAPVSSHGIPAIKKSIAILNEAKNAKDDATKIAILRKYFSINAKEPTGISDKKISEFKSQVDRIFANGAVRGVPTLIDAKDLGL